MTGRGESNMAGKPKSATGPTCAMKLRCFYLFGVYATLTAIAVACAQREGGPITVDNAFISELPPGQTQAAAYMKIRNDSKVSQPLNYVHSPIADYIEIHRNIYQDGVMQMRPVKKVTVNPGETRVLAPGGFHLMLFGVYDNLRAGDEFELTLEFETGVVVTTNVAVKPH